MNEKEPLHTPASIVEIFANVFAVATETKIISIVGIYARSGGKEYGGGYYYDTLHDDGSDHQITLRVSRAMRQQLRANECYSLNGYIIKKARKNGSISLTFAVTEITGTELRKLSPEDKEKAAVVQEKVAIGYRNLDGFIRESIFRGHKPKIICIFGYTGIVDWDVTNALGASARHYEIVENRANLTATTSIQNALLAADQERPDIIALIRGGGGNLKPFDDVELAHTVIGLHAITVTAVGHAADKSFLDQVVDRAFDTPTALGAYLNQMPEAVADELAGEYAVVIASKIPRRNFGKGRPATNRTRLP